MYPFDYKRKKQSKQDRGPIGVATVRDFQQGDFLKVKGSNKVYIRGAYDRSLKKYHLVDTTDVCGNGRMVKGTMIAHDNF